MLDLLRKKGFDIKNVHELNLILEEMGIQRHSGHHWVSTEKGDKYTIFTTPVCDPQGWHPIIVDDIIQYLNSK